MSIAGLLVRFAGIYVGLMIAIMVVMSALDINLGQGNTLILLGATMGAVSWFHSRNRRALAKGEFRNAVIGIWAVDMAFQLIVTLGTLTAAGAPLASEYMVAFLGTVGLMHGVAILATTWFLNRSFAKSARKEAESVFE